MEKPKKHGECGSIDSPLDQASWMVAALLCGSSGERIDNVRAYVNTLEAIVSELIARNVTMRLSGAAREAYKRGLEFGIYVGHADSSDSAASVNGSDFDEAEALLLEKIWRTGGEAWPVDSTAHCAMGGRTTPVVGEVVGRGGKRGTERLHARLAAIYISIPIYINGWCEEQRRETALEPKR